MSDEPTVSKSDDLPPRAEIMKIVGSAMIARALAIVAELGIADHVAQRPQNAEELAVATGSHHGALYRLLRMLASHGIFAEDDAGRFHNTPLAEALKTEGEDSVRDMVRLGWQDLIWDAYRHLPHTIKTGEPAFTKAFGKDFFDYLAEHPQANSLFDAAMALSADPENAIIARTYNFGRFSNVVDVGGGRGGLLAAVLAGYPNVHGVLFDQQQVIAEPIHLERADVLDRCEIVSGDFFDRIPSGGDVYVLKRILHDWDDNTSVNLLRRCREAGTIESRILTIDSVIKPGNEPDSNKTMDVGMMILTRGRERTEKEFQALYHEAGLRLTRIIQTELPSTLSIVEGVSDQ